MTSAARISVSLAVLCTFQIFLQTTAEFIYPDEASCRTPRGTPGVCVNLKTCPELVNLLQQKPLTQQAIKYLQQSQCGFDGPREPKVCCDSSPTSRPTTQRPPSTSGQQTGSPPNVSNHPNLRILPHDVCGPINRDKIIGGNRTKVNEYPWMTLLAYRVAGRANPEFRCGATVVTNRYLLTAAHCLTSLPSNIQLIGARVGEQDLSTEIDCDSRGNFDQVCAERYQDFGVEQVVSHPLYSPRTMHNDLGLIRLDRVIDFRPENARPICMPVGTAARISSKKLEVTGWGVTEVGVSSQVMLKAALPFFPLDRCARSYQKQTEVWYKQICMGGEQGIDSCSGDSGGPLQGPGMYYGQPRYVQFGIVSFGTRACGVQNFPGVYTRVDYYLDWILDNLRD